MVGGGQLRRALSALLRDPLEIRMARAKALGFDTETEWFHGAGRLDRLLERGAIDARRSTSGPMPYFTDDPTIASNYAKGKPDTSRIATDEGNVADYFTVSPREVTPGSRERTPMSVERAWHRLAPELRERIRDLAPRVGYARDEAGDYVRNSPLIVHPSGEHGGLSSPDHYEWVLRHEAKGNPLTALRMIWHDGGELIGNESQMSEIYRLAGFPHRISDDAAPWVEASGVLPARLRIQQPLITSDKDALQRVVQTLRSDLKGSRARRAPYGSDPWDKNTRYTPKEWIEQLARDVEAGENSFVWTSIPDQVTARLQAMGYDGIIDVGGKLGGAGHRVAIPFSPSQVRSRFAAFDLARKDSGDLLAGVAGGALVGGMTLREALRDRTQSA